MGRKRRCRSKSDSSSSDTSSGDDEMSTSMTPPIRTSESLAATGKQRNRRKREDKGIKKMLKELREDTSEMRSQLKVLSETRDDTKEIRKQLKKLTESHNELRKHLFHINGSSGDDSSAPRFELNQVQPPRYRLEFTCEVNDEIEKGQIIETKNHGKTISVAMYDDYNQIVKTDPLSSSTVMLVVVNGEFNQHGNQYNWLRKDFERNIKRPREKTSAKEDMNQSIESIVSNCVFKLDCGVKSHTGATILYNSSNKKVRLGAMVLSPTEERVLEGLSNPFFVRGHDRPARQKQPLVGYGCQERNGPMLNMRNSLWPNLNQPGDIRFDPIAATNTIALSTEPSINLEQASILQNQFSHPTMYGASMAQATNSLPAAGENSPLHNDYSRDSNWTVPNYSIGNNRFPVPTNGAQFNMDQIARPVLLVWDKPNVELRKSRNLLDQLMPLYTCPPKFYNCGSPAMHLMIGHPGSLNFMPQDVMQTTRAKKGILIEPLEPDDSDEEPLLKMKSNSKYRLGFLNEVCEAYYTWEKIKASDGDFLKVALFDENNTQITSGPLASVPVEVVVLHGDFNADGQHYWTPEEFIRGVVHPKAGNELPVLRGQHILALADGEACLCDVIFQITSCHARTEKFKLGVTLASHRGERIQEGISEPFRVTREYNTGMPSGFRFHPTDQELILHYLRKRAASVPCPAPIIAEVNIYKFEPWDLPDKATFGEREWYFFCPTDYMYSTSTRLNRVAGSGYWKATGTDKVVKADTTGEIIGVKKAFVFYIGRAPKGTKTNWIMHEYRLASDSISTINNIMGSSSISSKQLHHWVLCRIYKKMNELQPLALKDHKGLPQSVQHRYAVSENQRLVLPRFSVPNYPSSITIGLQHQTATAEPFEKLHAKTAEPQLESMTQEDSVSHFLVPGNEGSRAEKREFCG